MASKLSANPVLNPALKELFTGTGSKLKEKAVAAYEKVKTVLSQKPEDFPTWAVGVFFVLLVGLFIWYIVKSRLFENGSNIRRVTKNGVNAQKYYADANPQRKSLRDYLTVLREKGLNANQACLTNFYVSTVNAAGLFYPAVDGVISSEAGRIAALAGARCFVFDIWPDLTPGTNFAPVLQTVEPGSQWRRISLNALPFSTVLQATVQEAMQIDMRPGTDDPLFLYLRFHGKPRDATYTATARALQRIIEQYRLDSPYYACRAQDRLFSEPITNLFKKVVVMSNVKATGTELADYINVGPRDGVQLEYTKTQIRSITIEMKQDAVRRIQQNLTVHAPAPEDPDAEANAVALRDGQALGIQFIGMNLWNNNDALKTHAAMFGTYSFALKPEPLRYTIEKLQVPRKPENPGWGVGSDAGTPVVPPGIQLP